MEFRDEDFLWVRRDGRIIDIRGADAWYLRVIADALIAYDSSHIPESRKRAFYAELQSRGMEGDAK